MTFAITICETYLLLPFLVSVCPHTPFASLVCYLIILSFYHFTILPGCYYASLLFSSWVFHSSCLPFCHAVVLPFSFLPLFHSATLLLCHYAILGFRHSVILPSLHSATLPFCQVRDVEEENIGGFFEEACTYTDEALGGGGKVLIHCFEGRSRSGAVMLAYLMMSGWVGLGLGVGLGMGRPYPGGLGQWLG